MRGVFVTGTDTGVGKTVISACLIRGLGAEYWKPAQTGLAQEPGDTQSVTELAGIGLDRVHAPRFALQAALSPEAAATREGISLALEDFDLPVSPRPIVVEGAGGVLVPIAPGFMMADLMVRLGLPVVLVARGSLGTINHTLLSIEALRARALAVAGVVICGQDEDGNGAAIERHGRVPLLAVLPWLTPLTPETLAKAALEAEFFGPFFQKRTTCL